MPPCPGNVPMPVTQRCSTRRDRGQISAGRTARFDRALDARVLVSIAACQDSTGTVVIGQPCGLPAFTAQIVPVGEAGDEGCPVTAGG